MSQLYRTCYYLSLNGDWFNIFFFSSVMTKSNMTSKHASWGNYFALFTIYNFSRYHLLGLTKYSRSARKTPLSIRLIGHRHRPTNYRQYDMNPFPWLRPYNLQLHNRSKIKLEEFNFYMIGDGALCRQITHHWSLVYSTQSV